MTRSERALLRTFLLGGGAVALAVLTQLASDYLRQTYAAGGWIAWVGYVTTAVLGGLALVSLRAARPRLAAVPPDRELHTLAEQAEHLLIALGSDAGGMAAAEWFRGWEPELRAALLRDDRAGAAGSVDDLARICDALESWYVRERRGQDLLVLGERLTAIAEHANRRDLEEVAAARSATAHRMLGDIDAANASLGISEGVAPRSRTSAAVHARRQVEWALLHMARAERCEPGPDRADEVLTARDRLDDAAKELPRADADADIVVRLDLGVVALYQGDAAQAVDHLLFAAARARQARNASLHAHALELAGVAAWMQDNPPQAVAWWREAMRLYTDIDEREGRARCLQHLGSAALVGGDPAGARDLLEESARLRGRTGAVAARYLAEARERLGEPAPAPSRDARKQRRAGLLALLGRLRRRLVGRRVGR